jgi:hypothetical protein
MCLGAPRAGGTVATLGAMSVFEHRLRNVHVAVDLDVDTDERRALKIRACKELEGHTVDAKCLFSPMSTTTSASTSKKQTLRCTYGDRDHIFALGNR